MIHANDPTIQGTPSHGPGYSLCNKDEPLPFMIVEAWDFIAIWAAKFPGKFKRPELCPECERKLKLIPTKREKVVKEDGSIAARNIIARLGKGELRTDAALREQVLDVLVVHRHLIPTARRGHYMMVVPHD